MGSNGKAATAIGTTYTLPLCAISMKDIAHVGGKNASLGVTQALTPLGIRIPEGFAITTEAFRDFLQSNKLQIRIEAEHAGLDRKEYSNLHEVGTKIRAEMLLGVLSEQVNRAIIDAYLGISNHPDFDAEE